MPTKFFNSHHVGISNLRSNTKSNFWSTDNSCLKKNLARQTNEITKILKTTGEVWSLYLIFFTEHLLNIIRVQFHKDFLCKNNYALMLIIFIFKGADICGVAIEVGDKVTDAKALLGRRVLVDVWLLDDDKNPATAGYLGSEADGGFAEYVAVDRKWVIFLDEFKFRSFFYPINLEHVLNGAKITSLTESY